MTTRTFALVLGFGFIAAVRGYAQLVAAAYLLLAILGLLPATQTTFGLIPIYGSDIALHAMIGLAAAFETYESVIDTSDVAREFGIRPTHVGDVLRAMLIDSRQDA